MDRRLAHRCHGRLRDGQLIRIRGCSMAFIARCLLTLIAIYFFFSTFGFFWGIGVLLLMWLIAVANGK